MTQKEIKAVKALIAHCKDKNNPRWELDGILVDGNKLVATDTRQLIVLEFKDSFQKGISLNQTMAFDAMPTSERLKADFPHDLKGAA